MGRWRCQIVVCAGQMRTKCWPNTGQTRTKRGPAGWRTKCWPNVGQRDKREPKALQVVRCAAPVFFLVCWSRSRWQSRLSCRLRQGWRDTFPVPSGGLGAFFDVGLHRWVGGNASAELFDVALGEFAQAALCMHQVADGHHFVAVQGDGHDAVGHFVGEDAR